MQIMPVLKLTIYISQLNLMSVCQKMTIPWRTCIVFSIVKITAILLLIKFKIHYNGKIDIIRVSTQWFITCIYSWWRWTCSFLRGVIFLLYFGEVLIDVNAKEVIQKFKSLNTFSQLYYFTFYCVDELIFNVWFILSFYTNFITLT